jgi:hypothetical protein
MFAACLNGIAHATPVTICAALLAHRAAPPAPSLDIKDNDAPVNTLTVQPVSGATITAQYKWRRFISSQTESDSGRITLDFLGVTVSPVYIVAASPFGTTLSSLSCSATCGDDCTAPTLPASGQTDADLEFSTGTTYTFTCSAAVPGSATTTKSFTLLVVEGEFPQWASWATQRGQQFSTAGTCSVCQGM